MTELIDRIRSGVIGARQAIHTPFGEKPLVYADYTASGRSLDFIEDLIRERVLPGYANTHSEASYTGAQTTLLREQARQQIRQAVGGTDRDKVIFCGSGATAAVDKLLGMLNLRLPRDLSERYQLEQSIPSGERPVVFIGPYEHHSNELPWRESIADVVKIPLSDSGQIDILELERQLAAYADRSLLMGSFSAASNVTGVLSDVSAITRLLKRYGALAFWDYAAAGPYVGIDVGGPQGPDAVFLSPHKFVGGPGTPGVLVVKADILHNTVPAMVGGGTVSYVTPQDHQFVDDIERREEGGTPAIVEAIRAGLVFKLQQEVGTQAIEKREQDFVRRAMERLGKVSNIEVLGDSEAPRLSIFSLRFRHADKDLHYGFVVALLNDLFGIQARGGCSCAGPYGHDLLGMDMAYSRAIESEIRSGAAIMRPGWVRLNFNYFIDEEEFQYLLQALELVAEHGWRLLPWYQFDLASGVWRFEGRERSVQASLVGWDFVGLNVAKVAATLPLSGGCEAAKQAMLANRGTPPLVQPPLSETAESLRWFVVPAEVRGYLAKTA